MRGKLRYLPLPFLLHPSPNLLLIRTTIYARRENRDFEYVGVSIHCKHHEFNWT